MVCNRVHLLELSHMNVTETSGFASWSGDFSACCVDSPEEPFSLFIFAILLLFLCKHLCLYSSSFVPHVLHQFLGFITEVRLGCELEVERRRS
jgi:hypothetical protein